MEVIFTVIRGYRNGSNIIGTATDWTAEESWLDSRQGQETFLLTVCRQALVATQPPVKWVPRNLPGIKRLGRESDHLPPPDA